MGCGGLTHCLGLTETDTQTYLLILTGRHRYELRLLEDVGPEGGEGQLEDIVGSHQVEPRLLLMH